MEPQEMIYKPEREIELLYIEMYKGFYYYILSLGTHPCAYVEIPQKHKFFGKQYWEIENEVNVELEKEYCINVHGGFTYSDSGLQTSESTTMEGSWFLGWDYAHCTDFYCFPDEPIFKHGGNGKKWTTEEIIKECRNVIDQLEVI